MSATVALFVPHNGCPHRCSFCDQGSITGNRRQPTADDVRATALRGLQTLGDRAQSAELAFFGGSFTCIDRAMMRDYLEAAQPFLGPDGYRGIRISTRPDAVDADILQLLKSYGVSTVELGAQSMSDEVLRRNGRGHTAAQVEAGAACVRDAGLSLGLQMMTGLPGDFPERTCQTAEKLIALQPDCVRVYPAITLKGTPMASWIEDGSYQPPTLEDTVALCAELADRFDRAGIPVIRMGLHTIERASYVAGPWHPAFGELVESRRLLNRVRPMLQMNKIYSIRVSDRRLSAWNGQHRENILRLAQEGICVQFLPDPTLGRDEMIVEEVKTCD